MSDHINETPRGFLFALPEELESYHLTVQISTVLRFLRGVEYCWDDVDKRNEMIVELDTRLSSGLFLEDFAFRSTLLKLSQVETLHEFLHLTVPLQRNELRGLSDQDILVSYKDQPAAEKTQMPVSVILENIRSAFNVGSLFRTSDSAGIERLFCCGYTDTPSGRHVQKASMHAHKHVKWETSASSLRVLDTLSNAGVQIVGVETSPEAYSLHEAPITFPCAVVFGNERHGLLPETIRRCDLVVSIPMHGYKNSMNVGVAAGVVLYELRRRYSLVTKQM